MIKTWLNPIRAIQYIARSHLPWIRSGSKHSGLVVKSQHWAYADFSNGYATMLCEAAAFCLQTVSAIKPMGEIPICDPDGPRRLSVDWSFLNNRQLERAENSYKDRKVAVENAAYGVVIAYFAKEKGLRVLERTASNGCGFDLWMRDNRVVRPPMRYSGMHRVEVSGILTGVEKVRARLDQKKAQLSASGTAVVVEFAQPGLWAEEVTK